jgi:hypothetical protein
MSLENNSWAESIPAAQGLYNPELEKDACGVGFMVHVKGQRSHKIVSDASSIVSGTKYNTWVGKLMPCLSTTPLALQHDSSRC